MGKDVTSIFIPRVYVSLFESCSQWSFSILFRIRVRMHAYVHNMYTMCLYLLYYSLYVNMLYKMCHNTLNVRV